MPDEKRRFTRITFQLEAELKVNNALYTAKEINNLSIGGCLLPVDADPVPGTPCHLKILLSGTNSRLSIQVEGEIIRAAAHEIAVKFTRIGPDSLYHLQNIILYNSSDPDEVEREIEEHPGIV